MHSAMTYELAKAQAATAAARPPRRPAAGAGCRACPGGGRAGGVPLGHGVRHVMVCECSRRSIGFSAFLLWGSLWGMPLLFLVSGMGVRYAMRSRTGWGFAAERLGRLGIPFLTSLVLLVPPMFYLEHLAQPGFHQSYWRFWLDFW